MRRTSVNIILWTIATLVIIIVVAEIVALDYIPIGTSTPVEPTESIERFQKSYMELKSNLFTIIKNIIN